MKLNCTPVIMMDRVTVVHACYCDGVVIMMDHITEVHACYCDGVVLFWNHCSGPS